MARKRIGDLLHEAGVLTAGQLQEALRIQEQTRERLGDVLINHGMISEKQLMEVLEFQLGIPRVSIVKERLDPATLALVPDHMARRYVVLPLRRERNRLVVAMADPLDYYAIDDLRIATGFPISPAIAAKDELRNFIERYYGMKESLGQALQSVAANTAAEPADAELVDDNSPIVRLVNQILAQAVKDRASDVHFDGGSDHVQVRFRVDGVLRPGQSLPKDLQSMVTARVKIVAGLDISERRLPQDGRFRTAVDGREIDVRVSTLPTLYGEKVVLRILDQRTGVLNLDRLSFSPMHLRAVQDMLAAPSGMVLVTGPTGSGKTSTLYAALQECNTPAVNIVTIEDPVEYQLPGINQVAVNMSTGLSFAAGLRSILRQDPDIVMVGEIRDRETAEIATRAALTGHLVLSTLHTSGAVESVARLTDMGIEPFLVASALSGVIAQRLVRRVCPDCRQAHTPSQTEWDWIRKVWGDDATREADAHFAVGDGCGACGHTGYRGRVAVHELVRVDEPLRRMILDGAPEAQVRAYTAQRGFATLLADGLEKAAGGVTTLAEVVRVAWRE